MRDWIMPALLVLSWLLAVVAVWRPRRRIIVGGVAVGLAAVGAGLAELALKGELLMLLAVVVAGVAARFWLRRPRGAPSLEEMALLADFLSHQLLGGSNVGQALARAGQEACREPPTLPLPLLGPHLARTAQMVSAGMVEAQVLQELGEQFDEPTVRSFFTFLASMAQHVEQARLADALEGMAVRVRRYQELDRSFRSRLTAARVTRYVMLILVPGLLYVIGFHSPLIEGGLMGSPLGIALLVFDVLMLGVAMLVGNWMSRLPKLEF